jgi:hypothetical protein
MMPDSERHPHFRYYGLAFWIGLVVALSGCQQTPPKSIDDLCLVFDEKPRWYKQARKSQKKWGTPLHVQLAIMRQESAFRFDARPGRKKILGFIPGRRKSSAYGFAQVKNDTWDWYRRSTGHRGADRDDFGDAIDFIGWYTNLSQRKLGISKWDARAQYLAYHEGHGGYQRKTWQSKPWLVQVANKVDATARRYSAQLKACHRK